ncbi:UNVERIFIED_CONTAM: hypothetical protein FKN15_067833 [Acipenser sinensis]
MLSASLLFSGSSISKTLLFLHHLGIPTISYQTYLNHQNIDLHPAIESLWKEEQTSVREKVKAAGGTFLAARDGRADSPGHSARRVCYTVLDTNLSNIVDTELITVTEVSTSNAMEKEGLKRGMKTCAAQAVTQTLTLLCCPACGPGFVILTPPVIRESSGVWWQLFFHPGLPQP